MTMMKSKFSNSVKIISRSSSEGSDMEDLINCQSDLERTASHSYSSSSPSFRRGGGGTKGRIILTLFICTSLMLGTGNGLRINSHGGYEDLVVSIGNDVPPIACQQLIQNLQVTTTTIWFPTLLYPCSFLDFLCMQSGTLALLHACILISS